MTMMQRERDLADCTLVVANDDQIRQWTRARMEPWGHKLTFEQYMMNGEREEREDWGKDGALQRWVLVRRSDTNGEILSGCATYRRTGMVKHRHSGKVEPTFVYALASVVTPVKHHRKGYATHMLRLLHYVLGDRSHLPPFPEAWGSAPESPDPTLVPPGIASILWSDVGSHFYSRCTIGLSTPGWIMPPGQQHEIIWKIHPNSTLQSEDQRWEPIHPSQLQGVGEELRKVTLDKMDVGTSTRSVYATDPSSLGLLAFLPCKGAWSYPDPSVDAADPCGLRLVSPDKRRENDTIIIFGAYNMTLAPRFLISYICNLRPEDVSSLLRVLDSIGAPLGQTEGWVWGLDKGRDEGVIQAWLADETREATSGVRSEKGGHLLGVAWYGPQDDSGDLVDPQMYSWV